MGSLQASEPVAFSYTGRLGFVSLWDGYLAYTPDKKAAVVCSLTTGRIATVARLEADAPGFIDWVAGSADTVVYSELASEPSYTQAVPRAEWSIHAVDLRSGTRKRLARSRGTGGPETRYKVLPLPRIEWPWVVWQEGSVDGGDELLVRTYDLRSGRLRTLAHRVNVGWVGVTKGTVVFSAASGKGRHDLFAMPADGSKGARQLTKTGSVGVFRAANGWVAWEEPVPRPIPSPPTPPPPPMDGDDPVWAMRVNGGKPVELGRGFDPVPGAGFVVADRSSVGLVVYDAEHPKNEPLVIETGERDRGARWDVFNDTVAWGTYEGLLRPGIERRLRMARIIRGR